MADQRNQLQPADLLHRQIQSAPVLWSRALYLSLYRGILLFPLIQIGSNDAIPDWGNQANQQNRKIAIGHLRGVDTEIQFPELHFRFFVVRGMPGKGE